MNRKFLLGIIIWISVIVIVVAVDYYLQNQTFVSLHLTSDIIHKQTTGAQICLVLLSKS